MPLPFHIFCDHPSVLVYELNDGRFQLIEPGPISPFLAGYRYLLVEQSLAAFLAELKVERVRYEPAVLFDPLKKQEIRTHVRLRVGQFFTENQLFDLPLDGPRLLSMNDQNYFVSPELKVRLESSPFQYLRFREGLGRFAGSAA
jgi:hypothetical protein